MSIRFCMAFLAVGLFFANADFVQAEDWPQLQHDAARSGWSGDSCGVPAGGHGTFKWRWRPAGDTETSIAGRVQPVVKNNIVCLGMLDGKMYAINATTGQTLWSYQAGGPIFHTAAMDDTNVYFGSQDGKLYAVALADGSQAWTYDTGKAIHTAPALVGTDLFIGNSAGKMFCISTSGGLQWSFDSGIPIETSCAVADGKVYFGNEGCWAYCLDAATGGQIWKVRLHGGSMFGYWAVAMPSQNVVFFRTQPPVAFHDALNGGDAILAEPSETNDGTATEIANEQQTIRTYLTNNVQMQTFFALNTADGSEKYLAPVLYTAGEGSTPTPPIYNPATGEAYHFARSAYARWDGSGMVRQYGAEPMRFDPTNGNYELLSTHATAGGEGNLVHLIGDESAAMIGDGFGVIVTGSYYLSYIGLNPETGLHIASSHERPDAPAPWFAYSGGEYEAYSLDVGAGPGSGIIAGFCVADNAIFWVARYGGLCRIEDN